MSSFFDLAKSTISKAIGPQNPNLSFTIDEQIYQTSIWTVHTGKKKADQSDISVFIYDTSKQPGKLQLASNAFKRAKTLRHPDIIKFVDGYADESKVVIATEWVESLEIFMDRKKLNDDLVRYGLLKIATTLEFLTETSKIVHGNVNSSSVFVTKAGEFKLGNLEFASSINQESSVLESFSSSFGSQIIAPELKQISWKIIQSLPIHAIDAWAFGSLIWRIYNGNPTRTEDLKSSGKIPSNLLPHYQRFLQSNPKMRLTFSKFLEAAIQPKGYCDISFVKHCLFLDQIALKSSQEKEEYIKSIEAEVAGYPLEFCKYKILPELINALEYSGLGAKALKSVMDIGSRMEADEFQVLLAPLIVRLFNSLDRGIRIGLCENLPKLVDKLSEADINQSIYKNLVTGFTDTNPLVREHTLKAVTILAPKIDSKTVDNSLLRYLARLQADPEPGIRTYMSDSVKSKVLSTAFVKGLHDPFPFAKKAAIMGLYSSVDNFDHADKAGKLLPNICPLLINPDKDIRDHARNTILLYQKKLDDAAKSGVFDAKVTDTTSPEQTSNSETWSNWAFTAVSNSLSKASTPNGSSPKDGKQPATSASTNASFETPVDSRIETKHQPMALKVESTKPVNNWNTSHQNNEKNKSTNNSWDAWDTSNDKPSTNTNSDSWDAWEEKKPNTVVNKQTVAKEQNTFVTDQSAWNQDWNDDAGWDD